MKNIVGQLSCFLLFRDGKTQAARDRKKIQRKPSRHWRAGEIQPQGKSENDGCILDRFFIGISRTG